MQKGIGISYEQNVGFQQTPLRRYGSDGAAGLGGHRNTDAFLQMREGPRYLDN